MAIHPSIFVRPAFPLSSHKLSLNTSESLLPCSRLVFSVLGNAPMTDVDGPHPPSSTTFSPPTFLLPQDSHSSPSSSHTPLSFQGCQETEREIYQPISSCHFCFVKSKAIQIDNNWQVCDLYSQNVHQSHTCVCYSRPYLGSTT